MTIFLGSKIISAEITAFINGHTVQIHRDLDRGSEETGKSGKPLTGTKRVLPAIKKL